MDQDHSRSGGLFTYYVLLGHPHLSEDQIKRHARESQKHTYTLLLVPRTSTLVTRILEEEGVLGDVTISSYDLQFIPLAEDVISLENDNAFKEIWVVSTLCIPHIVCVRLTLWQDGDESVIYDSMQALITLEKLHGLFPRIVGKGDYAAVSMHERVQESTLIHLTASCELVVEEHAPKP